ncbi:hypothetical protein M427DRAFT_132271 [Gonapodya prolifera JEL478]|uniref:Uncharacterized protein n=1 Tax=Gonapodya prolifera (strain JEL478) TaxID=1344416 RepID=A0A139ARU5_GONPJ|nr:hypothetical protein M427DRAFT_132271 [Gonapodya prolifera JEL478]|eukprot:KXS19263.1 hypothetical protein M427DRAFT_132271 [Gonapodya prolifera JEL478]
MSSKSSTVCPSPFHEAVAVASLLGPAPTAPHPPDPTAVLPESLPCHGPGMAPLALASIPTAVRPEESPHVPPAAFVPP